jgi:hypothetical protein
VYSLLIIQCISYCQIMSSVSKSEYYLLHITRVSARANEESKKVEFKVRGIYKGCNYTATSFLPTTWHRQPQVEWG